MHTRLSAFRLEALFHRIFSSTSTTALTAATRPYRILLPVFFLILLRPIVQTSKARCAVKTQRRPISDSQFDLNRRLEKHKESPPHHHLWDLSSSRFFDLVSFARSDSIRF